MHNSCVSNNYNFLLSLIAASKQIITELNKREKLIHEENYDIWNQKFPLILQDMEVAEVITHVVPTPTPNIVAISSQHRSDPEAYIA